MSKKKKKKKKKERNVMYVRVHRTLHHRSIKIYWWYKPWYLSMNSLNVNRDFHERHRSLCKHGQYHFIYQILIIIMYKFNLICIYLSLLNIYRNNLIRYIWIITIYRGTISPEISVSIHCILTKSHPRYLSLIIIYLQNLKRDIWVYSF